MSLLSNLWSDRQAPQRDRYVYFFDEKVRSRIMHTLHQQQDLSNHFDFVGMLDEVEDMLCAKYGGPYRNAYRIAARSTHAAINHFFICSDDEVLVFLEMCFRTNTIGLHNVAEQAVSAINQIFEEEGIGYELTPPRLVDTGKPGMLHGRPTGGNTLRPEYPQVVKKGERTVHHHAVKPALDVLADPRFATANSELLDAFEDVRQGDYADAITSCGAAFESVLKTICTIKNWQFDPNRDACAKLVEVCRDNGLFEPFYTETFKSVGTVRNKVGDAHGKGPVPQAAADQKSAEHMIAMTCSHIKFLIQQAGI